MPADDSEDSSNPVPPPLRERTIVLADEAATETFGARLAHALRTAEGARQAGLQVQLRGDLGTGKTTLVRSVLRALGHAGRVRSPTYTLVEPYTLSGNDGRTLQVYHFDLYRFADPLEWIDAGFREYFDGQAICFVEWPERAGALLGLPDLSLSLALQDSGRRLLAQAHTQSGAECLDRC